MKTIVLIFCALALAGCGSGGLDITKLPVTDDTVTSIAGNITDASVQKEAVYFDAVKNRDKAYKSMYEKSGFNVKFKLVEVSPGVKIQMMEEVSFKEAPKFDQPLPTGPSEHPVWKFATSTVNAVKDGFLIYTGIKALDNVLTGATNAAQPKYYGNYNPQTATPFIVDPVIVQ